MSNIIRRDDSNEFNFDALQKAYETGILKKEDFASDEDWINAIDMFTEQMDDETELLEAQEMVNDFTNPSNWGVSPMRDAALRRQMAQDPDWDTKQWNTELDPEIDQMINEFNNRNRSNDNSEDENEEFPVRGDENTRYFGHFQADYEDFDWDNNYTEVGFPDGQFLANGLDAPASAFLAECWRSHNSDGAYDYIDMLADDNLRETIGRIYDTCDGSHLDRSQVEFDWEQEQVDDDNLGFHI